MHPDRHRMAAKLTARSVRRPESRKTPRKYAQPCACASTALGRQAAVHEAHGRGAVLVDQVDLSRRAVGRHPHPAVLPAVGEHEPAVRNQLDEATDHGRAVRMCPSAARRPTQGRPRPRADPADATAGSPAPCASSASAMSKPAEPTWSPPSERGAIGRRPRRRPSERRRCLRARPRSPEHPGRPWCGRTPRRSRTQPPRSTSIPRVGSGRGSSVLAHQTRAVISA